MVSPVYGRMAPEDILHWKIVRFPRKLVHQTEYAQENTSLCPAPG